MNQKDLMKKAMVWLMSLMGVYFLYTLQFPLAPELHQYINAEEIRCVRVLLDETQIVKYSTPEEIKDITDCLLGAKPTRRGSSNDRPLTDSPYYEIDIYFIDEDKMSNWYFVYEEKNEIIVEVPYGGKYIIDSEILTYLNGN